MKGASDNISERIAAHANRELKELGVDTKLPAFPTHAGNEVARDLEALTRNRSGRS